MAAEEGHVLEVHLSIYPPIMFAQDPFVAVETKFCKGVFIQSWTSFVPFLPWRIPGLELLAATGMQVIHPVGLFESFL